MDILQKSPTGLDNLVTFIDKEHSIPQDLDKYMELLSFFDSLKNEMNEAVRKKMKELLPDLILGIDEDQILPMLLPFVIRVETRLNDSGIYDITLSDLYDNEGYELFCKINQLGLKQSMAFLIEEMEEFGAGWKNAGHAAQPSITGSGVKVYSNSFITLAIAAAYDYSCSKHQLEKANKKYKEDIQFTMDAAATNTERKTIKYLNEVYLVDAENAISLFTFHLMDKYLSAIIDSGEFDVRALQYSDFTKSQKLLKGIDNIDDKKPILEMAFLSCPYNEAVYTKAVEFNLFNLETLKTANRYCPDNQIVEQIISGNKVYKAYKGKINYAEEYERLIPVLSIIAFQKHISQEDAAKILFNDQYSLYCETFSYLSGVSNGNDLKSFILNFVESDYILLYSMSKSDIYAKIYEYVSKTVNNDNFNFLKKIGFDFSKLPFDNADGLIVECWSNKLSEAVLEFVFKCKKQRESLENLNKELEKHFKNCTNKREELQQRLDSLGVFKISEKRSIKNEIDKINSELEQYRKEVDYENQKSLFQKRFI